MRSGTLWTAGVVGFAKAINLCRDELAAESKRLAELRNRLLEGLTESLADVTLCGPAVDNPAGLRLPGNLNLSFAYVDGEALLMSMGDLAVSSGAACTSTDPEPSHVLRALGMADDLVRSSLRFGLGRFNTSEEVEFAVSTVCSSVQKLRRMSSLSGG